ncbi:MAG TPA: hypothetical protein VFG30_24980 [Polyangiales bacterium]|nr:hypothetical protein [Polyangiales bacterium]
MAGAAADGCADEDECGLSAEAAAGADPVDGTLGAPAPAADLAGGDPTGCAGLAAGVFAAVGCGTVADESRLPGGLEFAAADGGGPDSAAPFPVEGAASGAEAATPAGAAEAGGRAESGGAPCSPPEEDALGVNAAESPPQAEQAAATTIAQPSATKVVVRTKCRD